MSPSPTIHRDDTALVIIDVQDRLLPYIHGGGRVVANAVKLIRFAKIVGLPILWAEQEKLGDTAAPIRTELPDQAPVRKVEFGCLANGEFRAQLEALGRKTLLLAGIEAHVCVAQTALQALPGYAVHVVGDAVSSRAPENCEVALARLRQAGAVITSTEMAIYELLVQAGTEEFRQVLPLVK